MKTQLTEYNDVSCMSEFYPALIFEQALKSIQTVLSPSTLSL
jgi:hypothetical protein